jgi:hypothetical protein
VVSEPSEPFVQVGMAGLAGSSVRAWGAGTADSDAEQKAVAAGRSMAVVPEVDTGPEEEEVEVVDKAG